MMLERGSTHIGQKNCTRVLVSQTGRLFRLVCKGGEARERIGPLEG